MLNRKVINKHNCYISIIVSAVLFFIIAGRRLAPSLLFPWLGRYRVVGRVTDISFGSPVELAEINIAGNKTYTTFLGLFHYEQLTNFPSVSLTPISDLELVEDGCYCSPSYEVKAFDRLNWCFFEVAPTLPASIRRFGKLVLQAKDESTPEIEYRYNWQWAITHPDDLYLWDDGLEEFVAVNSYKDWIDNYLGRRVVSYSLYSDPVEVNSWTNPLTGIYYPQGVWEVEVTWQREDGSTFTSKEHLIRHDRWWRIFLSADPRQVRNYVVANKSILRLLKKI